MITEHDLREAIAECQGVRDPNANTCIKLAAYLILLDHLFPTNTPETPVVRPSYSFAEPPKTTYYNYESGTEFGKTVKGKDPDRIFAVMDEAMTLMQATNPRLYRAIIDKLND